MADLLQVPDDSSDQSKSRRMSKTLTTRRKSLFKTLGLQNTQYAHGGRRLTKAILDLPEEKEKPKVKLENTYKMKPDADTQFSSNGVKTVVSDVFADYLDDVTYDPVTCGRLVCDLTLEIKNKVKELNYTRYKIVVNVIMGQCADQGLEVASRCVWDDKTDNFTSVTYKNKSVFAIGLIHGIFLE